MKAVSVAITAALPSRMPATGSVWRFSVTVTGLAMAATPQPPTMASEAKVKIRENSMIVKLAIEDEEDSRSRKWKQKAQTLFEGLLLFQVSNSEMLYISE